MKGYRAPGLVGQLLLKLCVVFALAGLLFSCLTEESNPDTIAVNMTAPEAVILSERYVKERMNDASSYERIDYGASILDTHAQRFRVYLKYRGTNGFGGVVTQESLLEVDSSGNVILEK